MIGKAKATTNSYPSGPATDASTRPTQAPSALSLQRTSPGASGGPLQTLQPSGNAFPSPGAQPPAGAQVTDRLSRARAFFKIVVGSDRRTYIAARAARLEKALNDALDAAQAMSPIDDAAKSKVKRLLATAIEVHHDLSRWKGTSDEDKVSWLQKCIDMHSDVEGVIGKEGLMDKTSIALEAHALYFKIATGVKPEHYYDDGDRLELTWDASKRRFTENAGGSPRPSINPLTFARAASMQVHAQRVAQYPLELEEIYSLKERLTLVCAEGEVKFTKREVDSWCSSPPKSPWPTVGFNPRFSEWAIFVAEDTRARENNAGRRRELIEHLPGDLTHLVVEYAADKPEPD